MEFSFAVRKKNPRLGICELDIHYRKIPTFECLTISMCSVSSLQSRNKRPGSEKSKADIQLKNRVCKRRSNKSKTKSCKKHQLQTALRKSGIPLKRTLVCLKLAI